jgi:O-antigen/teichoic acid export membrane protein
MSILLKIKKLSPVFFQPYLEKIELSPLGYRLARGTFWTIFGSLISRGLTLVASIVVARVLGREVFGELGIIQSTVVMFSVFAGLGMGITATKHIAELRNEDSHKAENILSFINTVIFISSFVLATIFIFACPWISSHLLSAPHLTGLLRIGTLMIFLGALNGAQTGTLSGFEAFKSIAKVNILSGLANFPLIIGGAIVYGLKGVILGMVVGLAINLVLNHIALREQCIKSGISLKLFSFGKEKKIFFSFSIPAMFAGIMIAPVNWICNALLVNQPGGYSEMGILNAVNQWHAALLFIPGILGMVILPILSERIFSKENEDSRKLLLLAMKINASIVLPFVIIVSLLSQFVMNLYGVEFRDAWVTLIVVLITTGIVSIQMPVGQIFAAANRMWLGFFMNLGWGISYIVFSFILIDLGALGLALAKGIAYALHTGWTFGFAYFYLNKMKISIKEIQNSF